MVSPSDRLRTESSFLGEEVDKIPEDLTIEPLELAPVNQVKNELVHSEELRASDQQPLTGSRDQDELARGLIRVISGLSSLLAGVFTGLTTVGILSSPVGWGIVGGAAVIFLLAVVSSPNNDEFLFNLSNALGLFLIGFGFAHFVSTEDPLLLDFITLNVGVSIFAFSMAFMENKSR